jgi:hypothetical protein
LIRKIVSNPNTDITCYISIEGPSFPEPTIIPFEISKDWGRHEESITDIIPGEYIVKEVDIPAGYRFVAVTSTIEKVLEEDEEVVENGIKIIVPDNGGISYTYEDGARIEPWLVEFNNELIPIITPSPTATPTITPPPTVTPIVTITPTATPVPTNTPKPIPTPTNTPAPTATPTITPTPTETPVPTETPRPTLEPVPIPSETPEPEKIIETDDDVPMTIIGIRKIWNDDGVETLRPEVVEMQLIGNSEIIATIHLSAENNWIATIEVPIYNNTGEFMTYIWHERVVAVYHEESRYTEENITTIVNRPVDVPPTKAKTGGNKWTRTDNFEDYETALGGQLLINHVGDCFD